MDPVDGDSEALSQRSSDSSGGENVTTDDGLKLAATLAPFVTRFMQEAERAAVPGADKKAAVLELTGTVYEGARRLGALDGVKEVRGIDWVVLMPLISILIDAIAKLFNTIGVWVKRSVAK